MSESPIDPQDQCAIEKLHSEFTERANDRAIAFQDETYRLGLARGLVDGKELRDQLLASTKELLEIVKMACSERLLVAGADIARAEAAIAAAEKQP